MNGKAQREEREGRLDPDQLLRAAERERRGKLTVFLGAAPGVGKTYRMLQEAAQWQAEGAHVIVGIAETHGRAETEALLAPLDVLPRRSIGHRGHALDEFDLDAALQCEPGRILVDELAHTNAPGSRHPKRWQDVVELRNAGFDVATTLNIQHVESLNDVVASFTHVRVRETVPDNLLDDAEIIVVDIPPEQLIERLRAGKVYLPDTAGRALENFFTPNKLAALRELALRFAARNVDARLIGQLDEMATEGSFAAGERLVVAVSERSGSQEIVRAGKRLADALHAAWTVVLVETPVSQQVSDEDKGNVAATMALASSLGAGLVTVAGDSIASALVEQARRLRATQIIIGKSPRSRWFELRHGSVVRQVINRGPGVPVHVIPLARDASSTSLTPTARSWRDHGLGLAMVAVTTALGLAVAPFIPFAALDLLFLIPVVATATLFTMRASVLVAFASALAYNFFFIPPVHTFTIASPENVVTFLMLGLVALVTGQLAGRVRARAQLNAGVARLNASLARFAGLLGTLSDEQKTAEIVCREVSSLLDVQALVAIRENGRPHIRASEPDGVILTPVDEAAAMWALERGQPAGRNTDTLTASDWQFHPLATALGTMAILGVARADAADPVRADDAMLLTSLVDQAALAHERLHLEKEMRGVESLKERDRLRAALLGSIAHDLRTPLTAVIAATEAIPADGDQREAVETAREESRRLARFLSDLMEATRIETGTIEARLETLDIIDILSAALRDVRQDGADSRVDLRYRAEHQLVRADPVLLKHVLINLLDNALKYSGLDGRVEIALGMEEDGLICSIADNGPGLPEGDPEALFERFKRLKGSDRVGGSGLGLWIARNFAEALGVVIAAANRPEGRGAIFTLTFPPELLAPNNPGAKDAG